MIHIIFGEEDAKVLQEALAMDETLQGEILLLTDDLSVGPVQNIYEQEGMEARKEWWKEVVAASEPKNTALFNDDNEKMLQLVETLRQNEEEQVWIWAAQNQHDVCGYYWTLPFLKEFQGRVFILYLNNLPFINEKGGIFYPNWLKEIPAKEFIKAKKLSREITLSEFEVDPDEWTKICNENKGVRTLEGGKKITQADYDFFDSELRRYVMPDWQKLNKIVHNFRNKAKHITGEQYLIWRIKAMLENGKFDAQGNPEKMKELELKTKAATPALNEQ